jgi:hypothetical protein
MINGKELLHLVQYEAHLIIPTSSPLKRIGFTIIADCFNYFTASRDYKPIPIPIVQILSNKQLNCVMALPTING